MSCWANPGRATWWSTPSACRWPSEPCATGPRSVLGRADERISLAEARLDGCIAYRSLVRYDAYGEMSGRQSSSVALLDARRSGVVISSILHRDQARVYVKQVTDGTSDLDLSPEELEAIATALSGSPG